MEGVAEELQEEGREEVLVEVQEEVRARPGIRRTSCFRGAVR